MRTHFVLAGVLFASVASVGLPAPAAAVPSETVEVTVDQTRIAAVVGDRLTIRVTVTTSGTAPRDRLVAHLNVASLRSDVYVDLEDWTASPTQQLAPARPGDSTTLSWEIQAVNTGSFDVYVALLPNGIISAGQGPLVVSPPIHVTVAGRRTLTAGGALPVTLVIPLLLGLAAAGTRLRVRRQR